MKYRNALIIFALAFIVQTAVLGQFQIGGVSANLILCCGIVIAFVYTETNAGILIGALTALIFDFEFSPCAGMTALPLVITMGLCIFVRTFFLNREHLMSMLVVSAGSVILYYNLYFVMTRIADVALSYGCMMRHIILYVIFNVLIMMILYLFMIENETRHRDSGYLKWVS